MEDTQQPLAVFAERLLAEKGIQGLDEEIMAQMRADLVSRAEDHINAAMLAALAPEQVEAFEALLGRDATTGDDVHAFLQEHVPAFDETMANALMGFRNTYLNLG